MHSWRERKAEAFPNRAIPGHQPCFCRQRSSKTSARRHDKMRLHMPEPIDVRLESLAGKMPQQQSLPAPGAGTFYMETFGCQLNVHDSEKVAGVLLRRGYRQVSSPEEARLVFYNTCSIREKAAQKVFSRLGLYNP